MRKLKHIALLFCAIVLAACSYRPLYGTGSDGRGVAVALSGVAVEPQKSRAGQLVRNSLISALGSGTSQQFLLRLTPEEKALQVSALSGQKVERHRYNLKVGYELLQTGTGKVVSSGTSFSNVAYDTVEQPIADLRASDNARERAAREVAEDMRLRLAAFFSNQQ